MPRKARIDLCGVASAKRYAPGALHHNIIGGLELKEALKIVLVGEIL
jgi:hypothetical protein